MSYFLVFGYLLGVQAALSVTFERLEDIDGLALVILIALWPFTLIVLLAKALRGWWS